MILFVFSWQKIIESTLSSRSTSRSIIIKFYNYIIGLEEQLLGVVVAVELPELSQQKANLVLQNANMNKQLYDIESEILY